jgi:cell volume regulation protein A
VEAGTLMLIVGAILLAGVAAAHFAGRAGVPVLVAFLGLGMLLGSDGPGGIEFDDTELTRTAGIVALAIILFEGGLTTPWRAVRPVLLTATLLSTVGVAASAAITAAAAYWLFDLSTTESFLLGAVVASTDAAAVFATLRFTNVRRRLARVLEAESGANDPMAVALTIGLIEWLRDPTFRFDDLALLVVQQLGLGLAIGLVAGVLASAAFSRLPATLIPFAPVASLAAGAVGFGAADVAGGSGFLAVYIVGLWLGNTPTPLRRSLVSFHQGIAFLAQVGLFVMLGLFVFPSRLDSVILPGLALTAVVLFVARPAAVWLSTLFQGFSQRERAFLGWAGLRGAVPIVLATFPLAEHVGPSNTIFNAVFFVVVASALVQGPTLEPLARRLGLIVPGRPVYSPPLDVAALESLGSTIVEYVVPAESALTGTALRELGLPPDALVAVIVRGQEAVPPRGETTIETDDRLYVLAPHARRREVERLLEGRDGA